MRKVYFIQRTNTVQNLTVGLMKNVAVAVMAWLNPLAFKHTPKCFRDIEMRAIWGQEEKEKTSFLPRLSHLCDLTLSVDGSVVKDNDSRFGNSEGKLIRKSGKPFSGNGILRVKAVIYASGGYHAENVQAMFPLAGNEYVLPRRNASRKAHIRLCRHGFRLRSASRCIPDARDLQVPATGRSLSQPVAASEFPLGVFLYAYILRQ